MFVTTAGRTNQQMIEKTVAMATELGVEYIPRKKKSVLRLQEEWKSDCLVVGKDRLELFTIGSTQPFFFHPNSAMFRIKRLLNGEHDPFVNAAKLELGMSFLDCTLGLASDSIIASFLVGDEGTVTGTEGQKYLAYVVKAGMKTWDSGLEAMNKAMARIQVLHINSRDYLKCLPNESVDCVYFDPMFEETILESDGIKSLGNLALYQDLTEDMVAEALRVARCRVILKDHYKSKRFDAYGFDVHRRKTAKFHFGVLEK